MSSYLLLRNNVESGPFTIEEIKGMSLKTYDLLWVVGKSAAWRYPGEINELKSFAPPLPEQLINSNLKKPGIEVSSMVTSNIKKTDSSDERNRENSSLRVAAQKSVYVNHPSKKEQANLRSDHILFDMDFSEPLRPDPTYSFSERQNKKSNPSLHFSAKIIWISTIILLFGAGLLTGFFISDRRKFFSTDANPPQNNHAAQTPLVNSKKEIPTVVTKNTQDDIPKEENPTISDHDKVSGVVSRKVSGITGKKTVKNDAVKKDSAVRQPVDLSSFKLNDSLKQMAANKAEILYQKIKAHPENYINLVTGRYSTGVFGGISSFLVTVTNNSTLTMNQVVVSVDYIQSNEKVYKTESLTFNDLEPGETVTLKAPKSPRGIKIMTRINLVNNRQFDAVTPN
jgi:uncharacterized protein YneF (UPF0154 family)